MPTDTVKSEKCAAVTTKCIKDIIQLLNEGIKGTELILVRYLRYSVLHALIEEYLVQ